MPRSTTCRPAMSSRRHTGAAGYKYAREGGAVDPSPVIETCGRWLVLNDYDINQEPLYRRITPRIVVEEFLDDSTGEWPDNFKFYVFGSLGNGCNTVSPLPCDRVFDSF